MAVNKFNPSDHIFLDITSNDIWLKVYIKMECIDFKIFDSEFEIKVNFNMNCKDLKKVI
jgi:hypothetical protein